MQRVPPSVLVPIIQLIHRPSSHQNDGLQWSHLTCHDEDCFLDLWSGMTRSKVRRASWRAPTTDEAKVVRLWQVALIRSGKSTWCFFRGAVATRVIKSVSRDRDAMITLSFFFIVTFWLRQLPTMYPYNILTYIYICHLRVRWYIATLCVFRFKLNNEQWCGAWLNFYIIVLSQSPEIPSVFFFSRVRLYPSSNVRRGFKLATATSAINVDRKLPSKLLGTKLHSFASQSTCVSITACKPHCGKSK